MKIFSYQPCLGDTLYCFKILYKLIEFGHEVYYQLDPKYSWVSNYIKQDGLFFGYPDGEHFVLNFAKQNLEENHPYDLMTCKYKAVGKLLPQLQKELHVIDNSDWSRYIRINRNKEKENELYYNILKLKDDSRYIFANSNFGVGQYRKINFEENANLENIHHVVWNSFIDGFTMFDWIKVFENAEEIHTVDTSVMYVIESNPIKAKKLFIYPRHPEHTEKALKDVLKLDWKFV